MTARVWSTAGLTCWRAPARERKARVVSQRRSSLFAEVSGEDPKMCPFCISTAAIVVSSATSTGGLAALAAKMFPRLRAKKFRSEGSEQRRKNNGNEQSTTLESGFAGGMGGGSQTAAGQGEGV